MGLWLSTLEGANSIRSLVRTELDMQMHQWLHGPSPTRSTDLPARQTAAGGRMMRFQLGRERGIASAWIASIASNKI
jgi:hypothetical protein